jgi:hypothetical protein
MLKTMKTFNKLAPKTNFPNANAYMKRQTRIATFLGAIRSNIVLRRNGSEFTSLRDLRS